MIHDDTEGPIQPLDPRMTFPLEQALPPHTFYRVASSRPFRDGQAWTWIAADLDTKAALVGKWLQPEGHVWTVAEVLNLPWPDREGRPVTLLDCEIAFATKDPLGLVDVLRRMKEKENP